MAIDTRDKRFSMMNLSAGEAGIMANPSGAIGAPARAMLLGLYAGIALAAPAGPALGIAARVQGFAPGNLVTLFELDATALGATVERFTSTAWAAEAIQFDGNVYTPIEIEATGFEWSGKGSLPRPRLRISNVNKVTQALVFGFGDLVGAKVKRTRTFAAHLDQGSDPDPAATFPVEIYVVERKTSQNSRFIEWELASAMDQAGRLLPGRQVLRDACTHRYRVWSVGLGDFDYTNATCPYVGAASFDAQNAPTADPNDRCSKLLSGCRLRFGEAGVLPTRQFPGVARVR